LPPGVTDFEPTAVNDAGDVVGYGTPEQPTAWIWRNGTFTPLSAPGSARALWINASGLIVGSWFGGSSPSEHAVAWKNGQASTLPALTGDINSGAEFVAPDGRIVGYSYPDQTSDTFILHAMLWQGGRAINLPTLGGSFAEGLSVNSAGKVVGQSTAPDGFGHAVMWQAPPLP
jgi:uncharacterized membrane protein